MYGKNPVRFGFSISCQSQYERGNFAILFAASALSEIALKLNPGDKFAGGLLRRCLKYARRWADLRALAMTSGKQVEREDPRSSIYDIYLVAEESGKPADVARARNAALAVPASAHPAAITNAIAVADISFWLATPRRSQAALSSDDASAIVARLTAVNSSNRSLRFRAEEFAART